MKLGVDGWFAIYDDNKDGKINREQFKRLVQEQKLKLNADEAVCLYLIF